MKPPKDIIGFVKKAPINTEQAADKRILRKMYDAYKDTFGFAMGRAACRIETPRSRFARLSVAAAILIAAGALVGHLIPLAGGNVAWAQVTERFQSVSFIYASIYVKQHALAQSDQFELWMGKGGYARMRIGPQIVFARDGQVSRAFDIYQRSAVEAYPAASEIIRMLRTPGELSLETVIRSVSGGKLVDITPAVNTEAAIGEDLVIFDAQSAVSPGWVRIYALRETRLPVGLRIWDPALGFCVDVLITYAREQPKSFFDPEAFEVQLGNPDLSETDLAYLFLKDPGGQDLTSGDLWRRNQSN